MCAASNCDLELIDVGLDVEGGLEAVLESEEPDTVATQHVTVTHDHKVRVAI
jgi:preprotein translocase subunit SecD